MDYAKLFKDNINQQALSEIKGLAKSSANQFFLTNHSNATLSNLFLDLDSQFFKYFNSNENKVIKVQCFYYYLEKSIIKNIQLKKPNFLDLDFILVSNRVQLSTESKVKILGGLKYGAPNNENESYVDFIKRKKEKSNSQKSNVPTTFKDLTFNIYCEIFSGLFYFDKSRFKVINEYLNIFKEKELLNKITTPKDNHRRMQKKI